MLRKCREKQHMPRKSGNAANTFAAIQKRQCSENICGNAAKKKNEKAAMPHLHVHVVLVRCGSRIREYMFCCFSQAVYTL